MMAPNQNPKYATGAFHFSSKRFKTVLYCYVTIGGFSDQGRMVAVLGGSRPNQFCECATVGLRTTFYFVMCDMNMTTFDKGQLTLLGYGSRIFQGALFPLMGWLDKPWLPCYACQHNDKYRARADNNK